jgi:methylamine dehydrogenase accessory protein MauD
MDLVLLARLLLVGIFGVAALAKLADLSGFRQTLIAFGVPRILATPGRVLLPLVELAVAFALLAVGSAWWGALGALTLLCLFSAAIGINLARGRTPECRCFGQLHSTPVGWATVVRNGMLAIPASLLVWRGRDNPGPSVVDWISSLTTTQLIGFAIGVVVLGMLIGESQILFELIKQNGRLLLRIEALESRIAPQGASILSPTPRAVGLPVGTSAPAFRLPALEGEPRSLDDLRAAAKPVLLVFSDPACVACATLLPDLARWQRNHAAKLTIALISRGAVEINRAKVGDHRLMHVLLQNDHQIVEAYQVEATPTAVLVRPDGTIGSGLAPGAEAIRQLVAQTTGTLEPTLMRNGQTVPSIRAGRSKANSIKRAPALSTTLKIGELAPVFKLPDLTGKPMDLAELRGSPTLLLFWNPACGFCQRMLEHVRSLEAKLSKGMLKLLIASSGSAETNQAMGLQSPIILDQSLTLGPAFGANGTPMAVLIDAEGRIASEVVAGASAVLALANIVNNQTSAYGLGANTELAVLSNRL